MPEEPREIQVTVIPSSNTERINTEGPLIELGQWYWVLDWQKYDYEDDGMTPIHYWSASREEYEAFVKSETKRKEEEHKLSQKARRRLRNSRKRKAEDEDEDGGYDVVEEYKWLGCLMKIGSNFVELESPHGKEERVHMDDFDDRLLLEETPQVHIGRKVEHYQQEVQETLEKIQALTARLGVTQRQGLNHSPDSATRSLAAASDRKEVKAYESALIKAKVKDLPALFEDVKSATHQMTTWMKAETLPMKAQVGDLNAIIKVVDNRIFDVSLYAGLVEKIIEVRGGEPAAYEEPVHLFQRRLYMDEECLANYRTGGMEFKNVKAFGRWLCQPKNLNRVFPFPRCMVAFKVRRSDKLRWGDGTASTAKINFDLVQDDECTFWYIRNGEQMHCLTTKLEFGSMIFPDKDEFDISVPQMVYVDIWGKVGRMISIHAHEEMVERELREEKERACKEAEWNKAKDKDEHWRNPHRSWGDTDDGDWYPFRPDSIYYDEAKAEIEAQVHYYNRIALILQGLFDRSSIFNPHPKAKLWEPQNFKDMVELVYDGGMVLYAGDKPDFGAYWRDCNMFLGKGSVTVGQDDYWQMLEAQKECARIARSYYHRSDYRPKRFSPYGNKGPGYTARVAKWVEKSQTATYQWGRERQKLKKRWYGDPETGEFIQTKVKVPVKKLFNLSAYRKGDYQQFFDDPRARADYVQWAGYLLTGEEYLAGNEEVQEPEDVSNGYVRKWRKPRGTPKKKSKKRKK